MKISNFLNIILAVALLIVTLQLVLRKNNTEVPVEVVENTSERPVERQWHQVPVDSATIDAFGLFQNAAALTVGKPGEANSMTIGWGSIGILWGHDSHVATVYVRKSRYTHGLMESNGTFTIEGFDAEYADKLKYLGTASGRDEDKMKGCGMTQKVLPSGNLAFEEGNIIIECRKLYSVDYTTLQMDSAVVSRWYTRNEDFDNIHTAYVGEITAVWVR